MKRLRLVHDNTMPTLFDFSEETPADPVAEQPAAPVFNVSVAPQPAAAPEPKKPTIFDTTLEKITALAGNADLTGVLNLLGNYECLRLVEGYERTEYYPTGTLRIFRERAKTYVNGWVRNTHLLPDHLVHEITVTSDRYNANAKNGRINLAAMDDEGNIRVLPIDVTLETGNENVVCTGISVKGWQPQKKYIPDQKYVQNEDEIRAILAEAKPWIIQWIDENSYDIFRYLGAPWMETLCKAGYRFALNFMGNGTRNDSTYIEYINRLTQPGTKPKTIFKTEKFVYVTLKDECDLMVWDIYRRIVKNGRLNQDTIRQAYDKHYRNKELERIGSILKATWDGRPVFTWNSLMNYLGRLETYEGFHKNTDYALELLADTLKMWHQLGMAPRIDSDSLDREHRVASVLCRQKRDEEEARKMAEQRERVKDKLPRLEYHEDVYFIRPIFDYDELIDEATQQNNCLACYADRIARNETFILQMRETHHPEKSLISIELSPDMKYIRQKYLAHNQPIRSRSQSEFIDRWFRQLHAKAEPAAAAAAA